MTALVVDPSCTSHHCRLWVGVSGGGVWRTDNALAPIPTWQQLSPDDLDQNSVGTLVLDPTDRHDNTLYLGTGEANHCSSGCEAGVGVYKSTNGGDTWTSSPTRASATRRSAARRPGTDAFLGRGINSIVIDPSNSRHIFVGSARAVRGLSHVIGNGGQTTLEPGANLAGLYESTDGGETFTEVWDGSSRKLVRGHRRRVRPERPDDRLRLRIRRRASGGARRRSTARCHSSTSTRSSLRSSRGGTDRTMFALTRKNGNTRIYLTDGTANGGGIGGANAANFWRTDNGDQPAAALLASQAAGLAPPPDTTVVPADVHRLAEPDVEGDGQPVLRDG